MIKNLKISTRKIGFRKSWKIMCAVAKCKNKKFSLFSPFAVAFSCSLDGLFEKNREKKTKSWKKVAEKFWEIAKLPGEVASPRVGYQKTHKIQTLNP